MIDSKKARYGVVGDDSPTGYQKMRYLRATTSTHEPKQTIHKSNGQVEQATCQKLVSNGRD